MLILSRLFLLAPGALAAALLTGCAMQTTAPSTAMQSAATSLQGRVQGGNQPVVGAKIFVLQANTTGYGGKGIAASSANASKFLLTTGTADTTPGPTYGQIYVATDSAGSFSITNAYTCEVGTQVYLYVVSGNAGAGINSSAAFMTVLGTCPASGTFATTVPYVWVNEVTTVATAYALAGFATDALHVSSSGTALAKVGIANAFTNFSSLVNVATGSSPYQLLYPHGAHPSYVYPPQYDLNTQANILAACVNSSDAFPTLCNLLFSYVKSAGASGTVATDTATEAIFIAHNPSTAVSSLFALQAPAVPFAPSLTTAPHDFTISLGRNTGVAANRVSIDAKGFAWVVDGNPELKVFTNQFNEAIMSPIGDNDNSGIDRPSNLAFDQNGFVWVTQNTSQGVDVLVKLTSAGANAGLFFGNGLYGPDAVAVDGAGEVWVGEQSNNNQTYLSHFLPTGAAATNSPFLLTNSGGVQDVAVSGTGDVWVTGTNLYLSSGNIFRVPRTSSNLTVPAIPMASRLFNVAIDAGGDVWSPNVANAITELDPTGNPVPGSPYATPGHLGYAIAIDGGGQVWTAGQDNFMLVQDASGQAVSPTDGLLPYQQSYFINDIAIDGSGDVWYVRTGQSGASQLFELIGAAVPVVTPLSANLAAPYGSAAINKP